MIPTKPLHLKIGQYTLHSIPTGLFGLDGGAMFGTVPKVLWEKQIPSDDQNRIPMEARALLLKSHDRNILIDTGNGSDFLQKYGPKLGAKFSALYGIDQNGPSLEKSLSLYGLQPQDITDVILTHLHFDHAGGATCYDPERNAIVPTFSKARYYIQQDNLTTALNPNIREKASYLKPNITPLVESEQLHVLNSISDLQLPDIELRLSNGHTQGQQNVLVTDGTNGLFYGADLIPTHAHVRLAWVMGYDLDPLTLIQEKQSILTELATNKWYLFFEHDPYMAACQVTQENDDFKVDQGFHLQ